MKFKLIDFVIKKEVFENTEDKLRVSRVKEFTRLLKKKQKRTYGIMSVPVVWIDKLSGFSDSTEPNTVKGTVKGIVKCECCGLIGCEKDNQHKPLWTQNVPVRTQIDWDKKFKPKTSKGCKKEVIWGGRKYLCGQIEDLKHSDHIIYCDKCQGGGK